MSDRVHASGYRERNHTADRTLAILGMFSDTQRSITAVEVSERLGVARSTAYRYVQSLVREEFLEESVGGGFRLGVRILELARLARRSYGLAEIALPVMRDLAARFQESVLLTRRIGTSIVCVHREDSVSPPRMSYERGSILPANAGASAHVLFAWLPEPELRALFDEHRFARFTERTIVSLDKLLGRYERARAAGYVISHGEVDAHLLGVAVPIFDGDGRVAAGLSMAMIEGRMQAPALPDMVAALRESARSITSVANLSE